MAKSIRSMKRIVSIFGIPVRYAIYEQDELALLLQYQH